MTDPKPLSEEDERMLREHCVVPQSGDVQPRMISAEAAMQMFATIDQLRKANDRLRGQLKAERDLFRKKCDEERDRRVLHAGLGGCTMSDKEPMSSEELAPYREPYATFPPHVGKRLIATIDMLRSRLVLAREDRDAYLREAEEGQETIDQLCKQRDELLRFKRTVVEALKHRVKTPGGESEDHA